MLSDIFVWNGQGANLNSQWIHQSERERVRILLNQSLVSSVEYKWRSLQDLNQGFCYKDLQGAGNRIPTSVSGFRGVARCSEKILVLAPSRIVVQLNLWIWSNTLGTIQSEDRNHISRIQSYRGNQGQCYRVLPTQRYLVTRPGIDSFAS